MLQSIPRLKPETGACRRLNPQALSLRRGIRAAGSIGGAQGASQLATNTATNKTTRTGPRLGAVVTVNGSCASPAAAVASPAAATSFVMQAIPSRLSFASSEDEAEEPSPSCALPTALPSGGSCREVLGMAGKQQGKQSPSWSRQWWLAALIVLAFSVGLARMVLFFYFISLDGGGGAVTARREWKDANIELLVSRAARAQEWKEDPPDGYQLDGLFELMDAPAAAAEAHDGPYHARDFFLQDYKLMLNNLRIYVYPHAKDDPFRNIFSPSEVEPSGNYASESYFKKALMSSSLVTTDPSQADLFFMPFSISGMRHDPRISVGGIKDFVRNYTRGIRQKYPYWNRTGGSDHFYVACHSVAKSALDDAPEVRWNAIQVVCSSSYFVQGYIPHKDVPMPQIWPRKGSPSLASKISQRKTLAFFAGGANSHVRSLVVKTWASDPDIKVYSSRIPTPYSDALLSSKFCLHVKGFEVNTARIGDAFYYGCVPVVIANHYDLAFGSVLDWKRFAVVVTTKDIPRLKSILSGISRSEYKRMHRNVMDVRRHFQWHSPPVDYDVFYMVVYQLWQRRATLLSTPGQRKP